MMKPEFFLCTRWTTVLYVLYSSAFLISVRCLYRVVEYFMGITGDIYRNENYFHVRYILMGIHNPI